MNKKHFLSLENKDRKYLEYLIKLAKKLKSMPYQKSQKILSGKVLAMIFQKPSNRTRVSFEVGMYQLGGKAINLQSQEIGMGTRESVADVAQTLSRYVDGVMIRAINHVDIEEFSKYATIPIINGLSDLFHPCQAMADILTIIEHRKNLKNLTLTYIGDGNNVCISLMKASKIFGFNMRIACPKGYEPQEDLGNTCKIYLDPYEASEKADVLYTDVWTSMGQEAEAKKRKKDFNGYCISSDLLKVASSDVLIMHCLPAHRGEEITQEVMQSPHSVIFDQAENRLHAQKAVLVSLLS